MFPSEEKEEAATHHIARAHLPLRRAVPRVPLPWCVPPPVPFHSFRRFRRRKRLCNALDTTLNDENPSPLARSYKIDIAVTFTHVSLPRKFILHEHASIQCKLIGLLDGSLDPMPFNSARCLVRTKGGTLYCLRGIWNYGWGDTCINTHSIIQRRMFLERYSEGNARGMEGARRGLPSVFPVYPLS